MKKIRYVVRSAEFTWAGKDLSIYAALPLDLSKQLGLASDVSTEQFEITDSDGNRVHNLENNAEYIFNVVQRPPRLKPTPKKKQS